MHKIGIIGYGICGLAVETGLQTISDIYIYDKYKSSDSLATVISESNIWFICLPTPMSDDGSCDTSIVDSVCTKIGYLAKDKKGPKLLVIKSTVPPGTTDRIAKETGLSVVFNPEFLTEKNFIQDFLEQDRIIYGASSQAIFSDVVLIVKLYSDFAKTQAKPAIVFETSSSTVAEMTKYMTNCFLATKLSFFNEMYEICQATGLEYDEVVEMFLLDGRIGKSHYKVPGSDGQRGFSLSCLPKDLNAMIAFAEGVGVDPMMLQTAWTKNLLVRDNHDWENLAQVTGGYKDED